MCQTISTQATSTGTQAQNSFQRPPSQATSVKAEPGSNMGSIASIVNCRVSILHLYYLYIYILYIKLNHYVRVFL